MVTEKEINEALETRFDGLDCFLIVQEILELEEKYGKIQAENEALTRRAESAEQNWQAVEAELVRLNNNAIGTLQHLDSETTDDVVDPVFALSVTAIGLQTKIGVLQRKNHNAYLEGRSKGFEDGVKKAK